MPIIAKESTNDFVKAPAGTFVGVCCDVVDLGMCESTYQGKKATRHKIRIVWQLADIDPTIGKRPIVSQRYTLSLYEKAALARDLVSWRGRPLTAEERGGFDVEKVIGASCLLNIVHSEDGKYANVAAIMQVPKGTPKLSVDGYVREKDRPKDGNGNGHSGDSDPFQAEDSDVPF